jgi:hypothetical protein
MCSDISLSCLYPDCLNYNLQREIDDVKVDNCKQGKGTERSCLDVTFHDGFSLHQETDRHVILKTKAILVRFYFKTQHHIKFENSSSSDNME